MVETGVVGTPGGVAVAEAIVVVVEGMVVEEEVVVTGVVVDTIVALNRKDFGFWCPAYQKQVRGKI